MPHHDVYIAGIKFRDGAKERLATLEPGHTLQLQLQPDNPHDSNAIAVMDGDLQLGFIPRDLCREVKALIEYDDVRSCELRSHRSITITFGDQE